jgi:hypothetical protein
MADNEESLLLAFKESGVEFIEEAAKAVGDLGDKMKDLDKVGQEAIEVLKSEGTVVDDLKEKIRNQKKELEALADVRKAGVIEASRYKEKSDELIHSISENETTLKRLTAVEADKARIDAAAAAALAKITSALNDLEAEEEKELVAAEKTAEKHYKMMEAADAAAGESEKGGFSGLAANVIKAEKVMAGLASGSGFGRMGGMLESITSALGMAGGLGMGAGGLIFAFEALIPKIETFIEKMTGAAEAAKRAAEQIKEANDQMAKFAAQPTEEEEAGAKAVKELLKGRGGVLVSQGVEQVLRQRLAPDQQRFLEQFETAEAAGIEQAPYVTQQAIRLREQTTSHRGEIIKNLMAGKTSAISEISGMAGQFPGLFPVGTEQRFRQALPENIEAARKQARDAEEQSRWGEQEYAARQQHEKDEGKARDEALKEADKIRKEEDGNLKDRRARQDKQLESTMRSDEAFNKQLEHDRVKTEHKAEQDRRKAEADRARQARENTPEAVNRRMAAEESNVVMGEEQRQNEFRRRSGAMPFEPTELEQVKHKVMAAMPEARARGMNLAQLVNWAMAMQANEIEQGIARGMSQQNRSRQNHTPYGGF